MTTFCRRYTVPCPACDDGVVTIVEHGDTGRTSGPPEHCHEPYTEQDISPCSHCNKDDWSAEEVQAMERDKEPWDEPSYEPDDYVDPSDYGDGPL